MNTETRNCQNCKQAFVIEPEDFDFYKKIAVPPPTWCPECRAQRRATFRNERSFHYRTCDLCHKAVIAIYPAGAPFPVYCNECWWSDKWDPSTYGQNYDPDKPFFEQNRELRSRVPRSATIGRNNVDSTFINIGAENRRGYFLIESSTNEDCAYGYWLEDHCKECLDSSFLKKTQISYETQEGRESYRVFFSDDVRECQNSWFLKDCTNVSESLGCVNLKNRKHHIFNRSYSKEEYEKELAKFDTGSYGAVEEMKKKFTDFVLGFPRRFADITRSENCSGNYIANSKNCQNSFFIEDGENIKYCVRVMYRVKDIMDSDTVGIPGELCYEVINTALGVSGMKFCMRCWTGSASEYCDNCDNIDNCFGCIGLRKKRYCILNKQYSKEDYQKLSAQIIEDMKKRGEYGQFFPAYLSPFSYNETISQEYYPLTEKEARAKGFSWREAERPEHAPTIRAADLPDHINDASDSITEEIIGCLHNKKCEHSCSGAFRIVPSELQFYRKFNLPIPRLCPNCRHYERQARRNPMKLWHRYCMCEGVGGGRYKNQASHLHAEGKCPNAFETPYAPDRPEIVYCEQCYNAEFV